MLWSKDGRDDLAVLKALGANYVRLAHTFGQEWKHDHGAILDRALELGLNVMVAFEKVLICNDFDCSKDWKYFTTQGFKKGLQKGNSWHPAVKMVVLMEQPEGLNFINTDGSQVECKITPEQCRTKAAISALDGFLQAEKAAGVTGGVNLTISWGWVQKESIDSSFGSASFLYGFRDMEVVTADPSKAGGYKAMSDVAHAFKTRWTHSLVTPADWAFINAQVVADYNSKSFTNPWFLNSLKLQGVKDLSGTLKSASVEAAKGGAFLGLCIDYFQKVYTEDQSLEYGLYDVGDEFIGQTGNVCTEDARTRSDNACTKWPVFCLNVTKSAEDLAVQWGGNATASKKLCSSSSSVSTEIVV